VKGHYLLYVNAFLVDGTELNGKTKMHLLMQISCLLSAHSAAKGT